MRADPFRVAVLDDYPSAVLSSADWGVLRERVQVAVYSDHLDDENDLAHRLRDADAIVATRERTPFPRSLLDRLPRLRLLVTTGMANAAIDLAAARERGIVVAGTPLPARQTAELAWALIMATMRGVVAEDREIRRGGWHATLGRELAGSTLGVLGLGRLGRQIATWGHAFDMTVIAWSPNLDPALARDERVEPVGEDDLYRRSDVVSIHLRLSDTTRGLVGARQLALLGPRGFLVNTSRGPIVDEHALVDAVRTGSIAGAGLDVYDIEPLPADHPLRTSPRTVLSPHVGFVAEGAHREAYGAAVDTIAAFLDGGIPEDRILT